MDMIKEKFDKTVSFVKEHKVEILCTAATGALLIVGYKNREEIINLTERLLNVTDIAKRSIEREVSRITFEIDELLVSIERLDPSIPKHKNYTIPTREARVAELRTQLAEILVDRDRL